MTDLDQSGHGFQRVRTYLGPSLGWSDELVQPSTEILTGGVYNVKPGDSLLLVDVAANVIINLPNVIGWVQSPANQPASGFDRSITVKDLGGNAGNFNIIVVPFGQQAIDNIQASVVLSTPKAVVRFVPLIDLTGWTIQTSIGTSGGGGGGDVFKAGNNTFTGVNTFQGPITVPTQLTTDNSQNVASTAYVKSQNYITGISLTPYALLESPQFTGDPRAPTPSPGDSDTTIATTAFVQAAIAAGGTPAPVNAEYITASANATLSNERVLTNTASITWDFSTPGQAKASTAAGGGNVSNSGTPVNGQLARWVTSTTIEGVDGSTLFAPINSPNFTGDPKAPTPPVNDNDTSIATTAFVKATSQPLDGDLTALAALGGTNTIYYRSGTDTWSPVTFSGLTFSGGILGVTAGGNVSNSGTPTNGQLAVWTDATHIQGQTIAALGIATLSSPTFTGDPQAPTPATSDNDTSIATTAFVKAVVATVPPGGNVNTSGVPAVGQYARWTDSTHVEGVAPTTVLSDIGGAPLASPTFTGDPKAPTPTAGDNDTSIATTAFVTAAIAAAGGGAGFTTGDLKPTHKGVADAGWILWQDGTIGDATSGASLRTNADTQALFTIYFNVYTDAICPIYDSGGTLSTRATFGTAAAAFAAHARMSLPEGASRLLGVQGAGSGLSIRGLGAKTGQETNTLSGAELPYNQMAIWGGFQTTAGYQSAGAPANIGLVGSITTSNANPFTNIPPSQWINWMIKL